MLLKHINAKVRKHKSLHKNKIIKYHVKIQTDIQLSMDRILMAAIKEMN